MTTLAPPSKCEALTLFVSPTPALALNHTLGPVVARWMEANLVHGPGDIQGRDYRLDDDQLRFLFHAYAIDDDGRRLVRRAAYSRPKGRAKSEFAAAIATAEACGPVRFAGWDRRGHPLGRPVTAPLVLIAATEEAQTGNVYDAIYWMLTRGPLAGGALVDAGLTRTILPGGGEIKPITSAPDSKDGGKETFVVFDETHLYDDERLRSLHATIRRNLGKRKAAQPWSLETSTMYAPDEGSVAESTHKAAMAIAAGGEPSRGVLFDHRQAPDPEDFDDDDQLRAAMVAVYDEAAEWMDIDRLVDDARDEDSQPSDVKRYFLNIPTGRTEQVFIDADRWAVLADGGRVPLRSIVCIGADGSRTFDTTVVAWAARAADGRVDVDARIFSVRGPAPHHVLHEGGEIDYADVERFIIGLFDEYEVAQAAYDPPYLHRSVEILDTRLNNPEADIIAVPGGSSNYRKAMTAFYVAVKNRVVRHRGDQVIARHVAATRGTYDPDRGWDIRKGKHRLPIDAVVAMALATWRAMEQPIGDGPGLDFGADDEDLGPDPYEDIWDDE